MIQGALNASAAEIMTLETPIRPEYERPPLVEKAISVAFQPVAGFTIVHYGLFWQRISKQFPHVTNEAPLNTTVETFDEVRSPRLDFELLEFDPSPVSVTMQMSLDDVRGLIHTGLQALASLGDQPASVLLGVLDGRVEGD